MLLRNPAFFHRQHRICLFVLGFFSPPLCLFLWSRPPVSFLSILSSALTPPGISSGETIPLAAFKPVSPPEYRLARRRVDLLCCLTYSRLASPYSVSHTHTSEQTAPPPTGRTYRGVRAHTHAHAFIPLNNLLEDFTEE